MSDFTLSHLEHLVCDVCERLRIELAHCYTSVEAMRIRHATDDMQRALTEQQQNAESVIAMLREYERAMARTLTPGEEQGVQQLDEMQQAIHGSTQTRGNGTYREQAS